MQQSVRDDAGVTPSAVFLPVAAVFLAFVQYSKISSHFRRNEERKE